MNFLDISYIIKINCGASLTFESDIMYNASRQKKLVSADTQSETPVAVTTGVSSFFDRQDIRSG